MVSFTRWLVDDLQEEWSKIMSDLNDVILSDGVDRVLWEFGKNGRFSVKTAYDAMTVMILAYIIRKYGKVRYHTKLRYSCGS